MERVALLCLVVALFQACSCKEMEDWEEEIGWEPGKYPNQMGSESEGGPEWGATRPEWYDWVKDIKPQIELLPPKYHPGEIIEELGFSKIDDALDDVMRAGDVMHDRRCALSFSNEGGHNLSNPRWYFFSGGTHSAIYPQISGGITSLNLFLKTPWALRGSVGVLTYDIDSTDYKVAIMWDVPFDRNLYDNKFNMKVYPKSFGTGRDMYNQMYKYAGPWHARGWHERTEYGVHMRGVMTDNIHSKVSLWVDTSKFTAEGDTEVWADCSYHAGWVAKYCWRECTKGWCWVDRKCSSRSDCTGLPLECYTGC